MEKLSRTAVKEIPHAEMTPELRRLMAYEYANGAYDVERPQDPLDRLRLESPVVRWELGVGFFGMDYALAATGNPTIVSCNPATGIAYGMGSEEPLMPLSFRRAVGRSANYAVPPNQGGFQR